uniref:AlNc14C185G8315 protein n=1 Tax=Albugo laibachii Nc14 TaxID=890382 RepID=F0WPH0_9STRA|nr:AlNc14C185G8315 [Albugo laibachii Nc14]|eukprot:CCA23218.1 AlNc14C185G8315 [Albugo laibachii Nc14]
MHFCIDSVTDKYYRNMLHEEIPITRELLLLPEKVWFVQEAVVKELELDDLGHPTQSPDLKSHREFAGRDEARASQKQKLGQIWYSIHKALVRKIVMSIPVRPESVVKQTGGHNKY